MEKIFKKPNDIVIAVLLACTTAILLAATAPSIGLTWDEPSYMTAADAYAQWFKVLAQHPIQAFQQVTIDTYWVTQHEHPPVEKILAGLVALVTRNFFDPLTANRIGPILMVALLIALVYLMVVGVYGKAAGIFSAAALISLPRFFFHAHLAALDVPVTVTSFAVTFVFWKTVDHNAWAWGLLWGIVWGLAVGTKLNAVFVPAALVIWFLIFRRNWSVLLRLFLMGVVAIITFILTWPWLYNQTWERILGYTRFHTFLSGVGMWYFGQFYMPPPWPAVFVLLWAVVPMTAMALMLAGIVSARRGKHDRGLAWLLILSAVVSIAPFMFGKSLLYDGERLFMPVFPYLAALAGIGFAYLTGLLGNLTKKVQKPGLLAPTIAVLGIALLIPQTLSITQLYPHLLSYYSEDIGGIKGAAKLGMETTYWTNTFDAALPYINSHAKPGDVIWSSQWSNFVFSYYQKLGMLRSDVQVYDGMSRKFPLNAAWYVYDFRQTQYGFNDEGSYLPLKLLRTQSPVLEFDYQGIPLMKLYQAIK